MTPKIAMHAAMVSLPGVLGVRITRLVNGERAELWRYRATALGAAQAGADVKWLRDRHPEHEYQLEFAEAPAEAEDPPGSGAPGLDKPEETDPPGHYFADGTCPCDEIEKQLADVRVADGEYDVTGE